MDASLNAMVNRMQTPLRFPHSVQHKLHITPVTFTLFGQLHRTRRSMQQYHTKRFLKRRDLLTDGGLLNPGLTGGR
ncbi:hypothetical protein OUHCRE2_19430 [Enterobacter asburiae]